MKKILIIGGGGYVGSVLTPYLLSKGHIITVFDLFIYGEEVLPKHNNLKIVKGDVRDIVSLKEAMLGNHEIIHLACISNDPSFDLDPKLGKSINLDSFRPCVESAIKSNISKFVFASSSSVYGVKNESNVSEDFHLDPLTDYSIFKEKCEKILFEYNNLDNFNVCILRPATVCGFSPRQRFDLVVNILTNLAYNNREITVFGGNQLRPNIHIKDMVRAYELIINSENDLINKKIYNVGTENNSVLELSNKVKKIIGNDVLLKMVETDDNRSYHISSNKILDELSFKTEYTIENAIQDLFSNFENNIFSNSLSNPKYFNIKQMDKIKLK